MCRWLSPSPLPLELELEMERLGFRFDLEEVGDSA